MGRPKKANTQIVKLPTLGDIQALVAQAVKKRVDEIVAQPAPHPRDSQLQLHQSREAADERAHDQDVFERKWGHLYFDRWGCCVCGRSKNVSYMGNAMCTRCHVRIAQRKQSLRHQWDSDHPEAEIERQIDRLTSRMRTARLLLTDGEE